MLVCGQIEKFVAALIDRAACRWIARFVRQEELHIFSWLLLWDVPLLLILGMQICLSGLGFQWFRTPEKLCSSPLFQGSAWRAEKQICFGDQWSPGSCPPRSCRCASSRNWPPLSDSIRMEFMYPTSPQNYDQTLFTWASLAAPAHSISSASPLPSSFSLLPCAASLSPPPSSSFAFWSGNPIWVAFGYIWSIFLFPIRYRHVMPLRSA